MSRCIMNNQELKADAGKIRWDLMFNTEGVPDALEAVAEVLHWAVEVRDPPYKENSWRKVEPFFSRYEAAATRHKIARAKGELVAEDSKLLHLAHECASLLFMLQKTIEEGYKDAL